MTKRFLVWSIFAIVVAHLLDSWAYAHLVLPKFANTDFGRLLRVQGFLPTWMIVAGGLVMIDWPRRATEGLGAALRRGLLLVGSATLGGGFAEGVKILVRRLRPEAGHGEYVFREWSDRPFSTAGFGMASSHAGVAFGAFAMLGLLFPRTRPLCYAVAAACALSRVLAGAHFLSDVTGGAVLGILAAGILWKRFPPLASP